MPRRRRPVAEPGTIDPAGRVFGYGRVSTGRQPVSIQYQETRLDGYHKARFAATGNEYLGFFGDDDTSGRIPFRERDAGGRLFRLLSPGDHVILTRPDRAFRNLADAFGTLETWEKQGIYVHLVEYGVDTSTPMGKLIIAFLALFADFERRMISERTKDVNKERRALGLPVAQAPVGYKIVKRKLGRKDGKDVYERKLVMEEYEIKVARRIYLLRQNREQWLQVRDKLRQAGIQHRGGHAEWDFSMMHKWMSSYKKLLAAGKIPPHLLPDAPPESSDSPPSSANTPSTPTPSHAPREG